MMSKTPEKPHTAPPTADYEIRPVAGGYKFRPVGSEKWSVATNTEELIGILRPSEEEIRRLGDRWKLRCGVIKGRVITPTE